MVKVLLYGYCIGVASSRRIAQRLHEDIAFRVLAANNTPDFRTISDFRKDHLGALSGLFLQVLAFCQRAGLVKLGHVALDGAKVRANASRHKAMSYRRMKEKETQLAAEVAELLRRAQEVDDEEDHRYGKDKRGDELPEELAFREGRLEKIREAMAALEAEAQAAAEAEGKEHPGVPDDKAQRNFTDAESRIMPGPGGRDFLQAYNCQAVVDHAHQVIVAARATNQSSDKQQTAAMLRETIDNVGAVPREVSADAGYYSAKAVDELYALGVDPFVAPEQTRHGRVVPPAPRGRIPSLLSSRDRMRRKLRTKRGRQRYALRMETVEPVFGQIKQGRGFRQFLLRGLEKVQGEWSLICTGHNLLKLFRCGRLLADNRCCIPTWRARLLHRQHPAQQVAWSAAQARVRRALPVILGHPVWVRGTTSGLAMEVYIKWNCAVSGIVVRNSKHSATVPNVRDIPRYRPVWRVVTAEKC